MSASDNKSKALDPLYILVISFIAISPMIFRMAFLLSHNEGFILSNVPDDAFYYFILAKNFAENGVWTFDGSTPGTGFHLIWGYLLAGFFFFVPNAEMLDVVQFSLFSSAIFYVISSYLIAKTLQPIFGHTVFVAIFVVFSIGSVPLIGTMALESAVLVLAMALTIFILFNGALCLSSRKFLLLCVLAGIFGSLARLDFGVFAFSCALSFGIINRSLGEQRWSSVFPAAMVLIGASVAVGLVFLHTFIVSGHFLPGSVRTKMEWAETTGITFEAPIRVLMSILGIHEFGAILNINFFGKLVFSILAFAGLLTLWRRPSDRLIVLIAAFSVVGYIIVYSKNGAVQIWYASGFVVPMVILLCNLLNIVPRLNVATSAPLIAAGAIGAGLNVDDSLWPHQVGMKKAGIAVNELDENLKVASWNAGLIQWYSSRNIVNIDGLVNDEVVNYIEQDSLPQYLSAENVDVIVDYAAMFEWSNPARGGYGKWEIRECLDKGSIMSGKTSPPWAGTQVYAYRVDRECVQENIFEDKSGD